MPRTTQIWWPTLRGKPMPDEQAYRITDKGLRWLIDDALNRVEMAKQEGASRDILDNLYRRIGNCVVQLKERRATDA